MEFVRVFSPSISDIRAVIHVGDKNVFDSRVGLGLSLLHGLAHADDNQHDTRGTGYEPLLIHNLYVLDVDPFGCGSLEYDSGILAKGFEGRFVVERKRRNDNANAHLKAAAGAPLRFLAAREFPEKIADRREDAFLLDADRRIAETAGELQRLDAVAVDYAVQIDVAHVAFGGQLWLHFQERLVE